MSQSKVKYHRLHLDEETDGTSFEKHTTNKLSIVTWSALVFVLSLSFIFLIIVIASKSRDKKGEYI